MKVVSYILIFLLIIGLSILVVTQVVGLIKDIKKRRLKKKNTKVEKFDESQEE